MPGTIGNVDAARADAVEIAEVVVVVEEELRDGAVRAAIDLGLQRVDIGIERCGFRVLLRIGGDGDLEIADRLDAGDEIAGLLVSAGMRLIGRADAAGRIAAQRHDMAHARVPIGAHDVVDFLVASRRRR